MMSATVTRSALSTRTVLLLDDSPTVRSLIKVFLMGRSLEFLEFSDGRRALQAARLTHIDLAIVDVNMPLMDGITFVKKLREDEAVTKRHVPVVLLTGERAPEIRRQGALAGAETFLQKPVSGAGLAAAFDLLLPPESS
jgi:two-component system chemotaxis response regulator CheY